MLLLVGKATKTLLRYSHRNVGRLVHPNDKGRVAELPRLGFLWAADNGAFANFDPHSYQQMLDTCAGVRGCLFVSCPDVVGDAEATFVLYLRWAQQIWQRDLPLGYVLQDGYDEIPWNGLQTLFIGGSDEHKLGPQVRSTIKEAKDRGKWVHMGRVNSLTRIRYAKEVGCDSIDGTSLSRFTDTFLPRYAEEAMDDQLR